jgi:hypothetical protein
VRTQAGVYNNSSTSTSPSSSAEHHYQSRPGKTFFSFLFVPFFFYSSFSPLSPVFPGFNAGTWLIFGALGILGFGIITSLKDDTFALAHAKTKEPGAIGVETKVPEYPEKPNPAGP